MSKKKPAAKPAPVKQERVTDEELMTLIAQHRKQNPNAGQLAFITALRAAGKSCSGGRVRTLWAKAKSPAKAAAGRKPRAKVAAAA
jgi:hypothetical protein